MSRFYFNFSFIGFSSAIIATFLYLSGNIEILTFKSYNNTSASTGFFVNRTVFSIFLLFSLIASIEYLQNSENVRKNFISCIYVRLFIIFITIGLVTTFSRIGNFLLLITMLFYLINEIFIKKTQDNIFKNLILIIILIDIFILGFYFGSSKIIDRFSFLGDDFSEIKNLDINLSRFQVIKFAFYEIFSFPFFGYGPGGFEILFQIKFNDLTYYYANHVHSDLIQFIGEFGLVGLTLLLLSFSNFFLNYLNYDLKSYILLFYIIIILLFDFSLHIPIIQFLFVCFFTLNKRIV